MPDNLAYWKGVAEQLGAKSRAAAAETESAGAAPRVVATLTAPIDVGHLCALTEQIEATYGSPLRMRQTGQVFEFIRPTTTEAPT